MIEKKIVLAGYPLEELALLLTDYPKFRSRQIYKWLTNGAYSFDQMSNLPISLRNELTEKYTLVSGEVCSKLCDSDSTVKLGIKFDDQVTVEGVILIDGKNRKTACLSTQAGCPAACVFCKTGSIGFKRNLNASEISSLFLHLFIQDKEISHVVVMGMGEPFLNLDELRKALAFIMDKKGLNISKRRITLSTCGIISGIKDLNRHGPDIRLAVSLTSAKEDLRNRLMPVTRENPLPRLKEALLEYQKIFRRRITLEMVLLSGINTGTADADAAANFARDLDTVVNLIPWNHVNGLQFEGRPLKTPDQKETAAFAAALEKAGLKVTQRLEKGRNILGACGQLGGV